MSLYSNRTQSGFTLVELAIVLVVVGLIISGVLRGEELLRNVRVTMTIRQVRSFRAATINFYSMYDALPGDMRSAPSRLPNCNSNSYCMSGDGNGVVGTITSGTANTQYGINAPKVETSMFFKHLALAHYISSVKAGANPASDPQWGEIYPAAKLRGGYNVLHMNEGTLSGKPIKTGLFLRLQNSLGNNAFASPGGCTVAPCPFEAVSPREAWQIDTKMDDGLPEGGLVYADDQASEGSSGCEGKYDQKANGPNCIMFFKIM